jgi:flagellar P-ring protein precursor FlgI
MRSLGFILAWFGVIRKPRGTTPGLATPRFGSTLCAVRNVTIILFFIALATTSTQAVGSRIKDLVMVAGARENQLNGWGLVVGLNNDGDKNPIYTIQAIANALQRYGINVPAATLASKNVAAVFVTADIKPFMKSGGRIDVTVSAMGDAKSLNGGVLLQTPLMGADGAVYAVAQGPVVVGGFSVGTGGAGGASVQKNHPTVAQISGGALVEKEIPSKVVNNHHIDLLLRDPDFTSAARMAVAINEQFANSAEALDPTTVRVKVPEGLEEDHAVDFLARLECIEVTPDTTARVIINERTGTIVATSKIRISACAVSHGELTISIASTPDVSQPNPLSKNGTTTVTTRTETAVNEAKGRLIPLEDMPTIEKVAAGLNAIGVTPRDMMSIFQAMKQAGALQAELIMR